MDFSLNRSTVLNNDYVNYEYHDIILESDKKEFILEGYRNFGWKVEENLTEDIYAQMPGRPNAYHEKLVFRLKRERAINNKMELTRLQRNFEACLREVEKLERSKNSKAVSYSLTIGTFGVFCMIALICLNVVYEPVFLVNVLLGIPAINGVIFPYYIYKKQMNKDEINLEFFIERKYEEMDELFKKGNRLMK